MGRVTTFEDVTLKGTRLVFAFCGQSGDGKTFSALQFAWGLAGGDASKVFIGDTENGRGRLYRNILRRKDGSIAKFKYGSLPAPFTPERVADLILDAQDAGAEVLIIDSISHEWDGLGGCHDIATAAGGGKKKKNGEPVQNWGVAKRRHLGMLNIALTSTMHIIFCVRAKPKVKIHKDGTIEELGIMPIQEPQFLFDMTASWMLSEKGRRQDVLKPPPEDLWPHLCRGEGYLTAADGFAVRKWLLEQDDKPAANEAETAAMERRRAFEIEVERMRAVIESETVQGVEHIRAKWAALSADVRHALGDEWFALALKSAKAFEEEAAEAARAAADTTEEEDGLDRINAMLAGGDEEDDD